MVKFKSILSILIIGMMIMVSSSCTEDNPVIVLPDEYTGPTTNGNLEVFVRHKTVAGVFIGGALVELFLFEIDRTNDNVYQSNLTPTVNTTEDGALFKSLDYQHYWLRAGYTNTEGSFLGVGDVIVAKGFTTQYHVVCVQ